MMAEKWQMAVENGGSRWEKAMANGKWQWQMAAGNGKWRQQMVNSTMAVANGIWQLTTEKW
jgi:hypothetical protein